MFIISNIIIVLEFVSLLGVWLNAPCLFLLVTCSSFVSVPETKRILGQFRVC